MRFVACALALAVGVGLAPSLSRADEPGAIPPEQFGQLHRMIRVQPGEQRFWQVPWKLTVTEARRQAAREGKPIFVWAGAGGAPIGVC
jgi:hypothetical protein